MILSHRITGLFHEDDEESRHARRTCIIRRVARAFQGAQDFGLIVGSVLSAVLITYTVNLRETRYGYENATVVTDVACPISTFTINSTLQDSGFRVLPTKSADILVGVYAGACGAAFLLAALGLDRIKMLIYQLREQSSDREDNDEINENPTNSENRANFVDNIDVAKIDYNIT
ncbi:hypothetical protein NQ314_008346 [Rhamnusium bicolor]|uniref:Uncharacterized protein n=1 Tax=Rhamnusium bicolor TaxID=1586634 RepID=A0AAV8YBH4_9CUCU|nr:hypothetical protein NQ314_008346 [Rhamnusium bicolor]